MSALDFYNLTDWFNTSFSDSEKQILFNSCPLFLDSATPWPCASLFLADSLQWYAKKDNSDICQKMCVKIIELFNDDNSKMSKSDLHFFYTYIIGYIYKFRDTWAGALVLELCEKSINLAPDVVGTFQFKPEHVGFNTLIAIEKKNKNWPRVLELARAAMAQGWNGKYSAWAAEAEKKLNK